MGKFKDFFKNNYILLSSAVILGILSSISMSFQNQFASFFFPLSIIPFFLSLALYNMSNFSDKFWVIFQAVLFSLWFILIFLLIKFSYLKLKKRFSTAVSILLTILIIFGFHLSLFLIMVFLSYIFVGLFSFGG